MKIRFFEPLIMIQREGWVWLNSVTPATDNYDNYDNDNDNDNNNDRK